eukprot:TRINITY_DN5837_c0_g1_i1.p1 TRINITY_DN5837_c0_g1~~TRINITY_DN5837_c0_g1_i1.p1  ORF type:complete len:238 (+),score=47.07 TRINITY_DN5837_c0_g1_i1:189-902(+)
MAYRYYSVAEPATSTTHDPYLRAPSPSRCSGAMSDNIVAEEGSHQYMDGIAPALNYPLLESRCCPRASEMGRVTFEDAKQQSVNLSARTLQWQREIELNKANQHQTVAVQRLYRHVQGRDLDPASRSEVYEALVQKHRAMLKARNIEYRLQAEVLPRRHHFSDLEGTVPGPKPSKDSAGFKSACLQEPIPADLEWRVGNYAASTEPQQHTHIRGGFLTTSYDAYFPVEPPHRIGVAR